MPKRSIAATERSRGEILTKAVDLASVEGLEGLTIGRVASAVSLSKSGLFAYFGSKEELQLAVIEHARALFDRAVIADSGAGEPGLDGLETLALAWLEYLRSGVGRGGCFFCAAASEVDDRPGRVRDRVVELMQSWRELLEGQAEAAESAGELKADVEPADVAFQLHALLLETNFAFQLFGDVSVFERARRAITRTIAAASASGAA
jgi:AcrR family transcriptional regulator